MTPAYVYVITNLRNKHQYVGMSQKPYFRWREHVTSSEKPTSKLIVSRAICKYGQMFFDFDVVKKCKSRDEAYQEEIRLIAELKPKYNMTKGGEGVVGYQFPPGTHPMLGYKFAPEVLAKIAAKTRYNWSLKIDRKQTIEHIEKRAAAKRGKKFTLEQRRKLSISHLKENSPANSIAHMKWVVSITDGREFLGIQAAADFYGLSNHVVQKSCHRKYDKPHKLGAPRSNLKGLIFRFKERSP